MPSHLIKYSPDVNGKYHAAPSQRSPSALPGGQKPHKDIVDAEAADGGQALVRFGSP
jgi:hypothetical protein